MLSQVKIKTFSLAATLALAAVPAFAGMTPLGGAAGDQAYMKRGSPQREGSSWTEQATCGAPARPGGRLVVRADFGSVSVTPGANGQMTCQVNLRAFNADPESARRLLNNYRLSLEKLAGGELTLIGEFTRPDSGPNRLSVSYQIRVPLKFNLNLKTQGGELRVEQLQGELSAVTAGGDIHTGNVTGPVRVETAGGDINLGNIGSRLEARSAGGGIRVGDVQGDASLETRGGEIRAGQILGSVTAQTAGGDIILRGATGPVRAQTAGGQIRIGQCNASIRALSAGGSIHLQGARGLVDAQTAGGNIDLYRIESAVRAQTAAGRILAEINAKPQTFGASQLTTASGDVQVFLPPDLPLTINAAIAQALGHRIVSDFPLRIQNQEESFRQRSQRGEAQVNGGGNLLLIRTVVGNIEIRKLDPKNLEELRKRQEEFLKRFEESQQKLEKMKERQQELIERLQKMQPPQGPGSEM
jgi:DUF4097 and DUF4098 domain-containing protein YvlB